MRKNATVLATRPATQRANLFVNLVLMNHLYISRKSLTLKVQRSCDIDLKALSLVLPSAMVVAG